MVEDSNEFNLGTGKGISIKEIVESVERITGKAILLHTGPKRPGDPATLVASSTKFKKATNWDTPSSSLDNIVRTAWHWYNSKQYQDRA
jgi:UDP-glucose 4-epimerase